ncbi:MAG: T9SS type A sorting domain-containing protein [Bacillota bacterium]
MKRLIVQAVILFLIITGNSFYAQNTISGNLLRIRFDQKQVNKSDTLGHWEHTTTQYSYLDSRYTAHITAHNQDYLLRKYSYYFDSPYFQQYNGRNIIENSGTKRNRDFSGTGAGWDVIPPYMIDPTVTYQVKNGFWLLNGSTGNAFINNNDSLYVFDLNFSYNYQLTEFQNRFITIIGEVQGQPLGVFRADPDHYSYFNFDYYLLDLSDSPYIDSSKSVKVSFNDSTGYYYSNTYRKLARISADLYLIQTERYPGLRLYKYSGNNFNYIKTFFKDSLDYFPRTGPDPWYYKNDKIYLLKGLELSSYDFNIKDTTFINRKTLLTDLWRDRSGFDRFFNYAAVKTNDEMKIYDIQKAEFINSISLTGTDSLFSPIVDSPYVYIHQVRYRFTDVNEKNNSVVNSYSLSAYPYPFYAQVKILYSLPEDNLVEITVFDLIGRKVRELVKGFEKMGKHEIIFNASDLPSGIYLYNFSTGNFSRSGKLLLLK